MNIIKRIKHFFIKYNLEDFKTRNHKLSLVAMTTNFGAAAFKIIAAFYISSYFLIVSSFYSLGIGIATQLFFRGVNRSKLIQTKEKKYVVLMYLTLLVSSMIYTFYMARQFYIEVSEFNYGMVLSLGIAAVSFTELGIAIRGLIKSHYLRDSLLTARKTVTLTNALVAIVVTQSALVTYFSSDGLQQQIYNAILGTTMGTIAILLSLIMLIRHANMKYTPLEHMTLEEFWELFPVFLVPHKDAWSKRFDRERRYIKNHIPKKYMSKIVHIGSTAVPSIQSKNIIDMLIIVNKETTLRDVAKKLTSYGYRVMESSKERVLLNKGYTKHGFARDVFHLHLRRANDTDEILFRDYLNEHPLSAKEYEALKISLADAHRNNLNAYKEAKTEFIENIMKKVVDSSFI